MTKPGIINASQAAMNEADSQANYLREHLVSKDDTGRRLDLILQWLTIATKIAECADVGAAERAIRALDVDTWDRCLLLDCLLGGEHFPKNVLDDIREEQESAIEDGDNLSFDEALKQMELNS